MTMSFTRGKSYTFEVLGTHCEVTYYHRHGHWLIEGKYSDRKGKPRQLPIQHATLCEIMYIRTVQAVVYCSAKDRYSTTKGMDRARNMAVKQLDLPVDQRTAFYNAYFNAVALEQDQKVTIASRPLSLQHATVEQLIVQLSRRLQPVNQER